MENGVDAWTLLRWKRVWERRDWVYRKSGAVFAHALKDDDDDAEAI